MKLKKWPETEIEYWCAMEALGGHGWFMGHEANKGNIEMTKTLEADLKETGEIQRRLHVEICEKFNIVPSGDSPYRFQGDTPDDYPEAPEGKRWYWDWYYENKKESFREDYERCLCSACPFLDGGLDGFAGPSIPCSLFPGVVNSVHGIRCVMLGDMTEGELLGKMADEHGGDAVRKWVDKKDEIIREIQERKKKRV